MFGSMCIGIPNKVAGECIYIIELMLCYCVNNANRLLYSLTWNDYLRILSNK